jgi:hypothetical protein
MCVVSECDLRRRWEGFFDCFSDNNCTALKQLLRTLQNSLSQTENFLVLLNDSKGDGSGLKYLAQPFQLKLRKSTYSFN